MPKIKIVMEENGRVFSAKIGSLRPNYDYNVSMDSVVDGSETIRFTRGGAQTSSTEYGQLEIGEIAPLLSYEDFLGNVSNKWFKIGDNLEFKLQLTSTVLRINEWKYKGVTVPNGSAQNYPYDILDLPGSHWETGVKIGVVQNTVRSRDFYVFVAYKQITDKKTSTRYMSICGFTPNAITESGYVQPYSGGGKAGDPSESGGYGWGLPDGDNIPATTISGGLTPLGAGVNAYNVLNSDVAALMSYLWGRTGDAFQAGGLWDRFKNYKFNPMAGILSLHHIPYELLPTVGSSTPVRLAGLVFDGVEVSTQVSGLPIDPDDHIGHAVFTADLSQVPYMSFADYERTQVRVHLPFCGSVQLDPSSCIGGSVEITYSCDAINGNTVAQVVTTDRFGHYRVSAVASGNAAYQIPLTGNDNGVGEILGTVKSVAAGAMMAAATGGAGALVGVGIGAAQLGLGTEKHSTHISGSISGNAGYLGSLNCFVEIIYGYYYDTDGMYPGVNGRPSALTTTVGSLSGYAEVAARTDAITNATDAERRMIEDLLRNGIII